MTRRDRRRSRAILGPDQGRVLTSQATAQTRLSTNFGCVDRKALLLGTALVSTLLIATVALPAPAHALQDCTADIGTGPDPIIYLGTPDKINCINTEARTGEAPDFMAIGLSTTGKSRPIVLDSEGRLQSNSAVDSAYGIYAHSDGYNSAITIDNSGDITATSTAGGKANAFGIYADTDSEPSPITIINSGDITAKSTSGDAYGIRAESEGDDSSITVTNSGNIAASSKSGNAYGIYANSDGDNSSINVTNSGDITASSKGGADFARGIYALSRANNNSVTVINSGDITATSQRGRLAVGIGAYGRRDNSSVTIINSGDIWATSTMASSGLVRARGIYAGSDGRFSSLTVINSGHITASSEDGRAYGILADSDNDNSSITVTNSGDITASSKNRDASGIYAGSEEENSSITVTNSGHITASSKNGKAYGIYTYSDRDKSPISIANSGSARGLGTGTNGIGIVATSRGANSTNVIRNSGSAYGSYIGIAANSTGPNSKNLIYNSGDITAGSLFAIYGNDTEIFNSGTITGFVGLYANNTFINQAGGVFEARLTSRFGVGNDLFRNDAGGIVHTAAKAGTAEATSFVNLETFQNRGTISTVDGGTGDVFTISNTPGGKNLNFSGSGGSTLAVDAFLGGPGSTADNFVVEGNVSGSTTVAVHNTNYGPGVFNSTGSPVVFVTGKTPTGNEFSLAEPIDTGFFDYDLFFTPTGSGFWSLKSFPGGGAFLLPQLVTAAQDIWHQTSSTWFDRTADLRVLLAGGAAPTAYDPGGKSLGDGPNGNFTPAVWARGSGSWLDRDDSERTTAYGRNYTFNLDRDLDTIDFQVGIDMGTRDLLSAGDVLVFGMLGGFVHADLDYDQLARQFDFSGGQVGAYATYLKGGLFVDTLLNVHLYELDTATLGFPSSLDANTVGLRTDTGYRFGSFSGGMFIEPLATIEVTWADIDGFSLGGNTVSFDNDANVRGRLGLRAGTTTEAWTGTMMEPFVTGSLWGNLTDNNQATLVSTGTTFRFEDQLDDVWGEVSAGVHFFNFSQTTAVFAKVDVTFGDDLTGVGGKAGMRVSW